MPQTFDYMGALREGYTPKEIKRFVKGLDQQNDLEQRGAKFVQKQARQREAVNSMMENSRSRASAGLTPAQTLYPAGVTRDPIGQDIQNTAAAPNVPRPTGIVRAENVAPDLVSAFEQAPESSLGDATSGYLSEAPNVKLRGARGIVQGVKDAPKAAWLGLNQAASAGMQAIGDVVQEDIGILTKAAKATSDLLTLNMSPTEIPADTGSNVIQQVGRDAYAVHTQGMQELSDKYAPDSWGGAVMNAGAQAGQQLGILGTAAAIGIRNPAAMTNFSLGALGAQSGLTEYGDARAKGFDVPRSLLKAGVGGGMEVVTEVAPMGKLVNFMSTPAKKGVAAFLKDAAEYGLQDIGGELLNTMITDVVNNKMQARPNMTPQEQADEVSRYFSSGEWKQAAATTFKQAVLQSGIMMGAAKGVQHLDGKIRGEQDPLTDGATFQPQNLPPVNPERQGRVDKLAGIMANESERTAQMRLNIANQRRSQQSVTAPPAQQIEQVAPEAVQPVVPVAESAQPQEIPAQIAPAAEAPVAPVATPSPEAASAPEQDAEAIAPELADLLRRKTNLEKAIFTADGTEKKTATKRMKDNYAALTATITALQPQNPEQEVVSNGQQAEPETATEQGAVATDTAGGTGGTAPADETGMGSAEAMPGGTVSGVDEQSGDGMPVLRPQPDVAEAPQATPDIMALVDGKSDDQIQKTIDMVRGLNPERAGQIEAYWKSKATPVPEPQTGQEPAPAAQDGRESVPPAGDATQKEDPLDSQQRETAEVTPIPAGRKERIEKMIERHGGLDKIPPAWREQWDRINEQEAEQQGDTAQKQPWDAAAFMAEMEKEQARSDAAHERAYQLETPEVQDAQAKYENGTIDIDEFEKQLDQAQAGSAKEQTTFQDMVREAARWKGAALNAEAALGDDKKARLAHSRMTTKADLDAYLMRKFGVDDVTARSVSNELTAKNVPADKSAQPAEFAGETWAHTPQPQQGKIGGKLAQGEVVLTATGRSTTPFPKVDTSTNGKAGNTFKRVDQWLMDNAIEEARSRGDEFNLRQLEANRDKPTQADKDSAEMYLFGEEQPPVPKPFLKPLVTPSEDQGKAVATSGPSASTAKEVAQEDTPGDLKGFDYKPGDGGDFSITKGNLTVKATHQGNGKYQASWGSATSSPHMGKQTVVDWADNIIKESQRAESQVGGDGKPATKLHSPGAIIGKNSRGETIREDEHGVRYRFSNGVKIQETVAMRPTRSGVEATPVGRHNSPDEWEPAKEVEAQETAPSPDPSPIESELSTMDESAIADLIHTVMGEEQLQTKEESKARKPATKRAASAGTKTAKARKPREATGKAFPKKPASLVDDAVREAGQGFADSFKALAAAFGVDENKLSTFPPHLDPDAYAKAKPHFESAWEHYKESGKSLKEFVQYLVRALSQHINHFADYMAYFLGEMKGSENFEKDMAERGKRDIISAEGGELNDTGRDGTTETTERHEVQGVGAEGVPEAGGNSGSDGQPNAKTDAGVMETAPAQDVGAVEQTGDSQGTGARPGREVSGVDPQEPGGGDVLDGRQGGSGEGLAAPGTGGERATGRVTPEPSLGRSNYHISSPEKLIGGTPKVRFGKNREAIEALLSIQSEGRTPTPKELDSMAAYTGWGSFGQELFNGSWDYPRPKPEWEKESQWLQGHLGKDNWQAAQASIINAHYTDPPTVQAMWDIAQRLGFEGGRILEPSIGIGNFFGLMPPSIMSKSRLAGIELDKLTGGMAQILYPEANVQIKGYQESQTADGFYDLVIGNWPFAKDGPADRRYRHINPSLHDYFFLKALDQTRPGGLVIGVTSSGTMDKIGKLARMELAKKANLVAAFRLPSGAFEKYAGTSVVTDIIILQKRDTPISDPSGEGWMNVSEREMKSGVINTNEYWAAHPNHVLGEMDFGHGTTRGRAGMIVNRPDNYAKLLKGIVARVPQGIYSDRTQTEKIVSYITNNTTDRQKSVTIGDDGKLYVVQGEYLAPLEQIRSYVVKSNKETKDRESQIASLVEMRKAYGKLIDAERKGDDASALRKELAKQYAAFVKKHGVINESYGLDALRRVGDPFYASLSALEVKAPGEGYRPATILSQSTVRGQSSIENPTIQDAYVLARNESMNIDLGRVAELTGRPLDDVTKELVDSGAVYLTPAGHYEVSDQYLSGNVRRKLREAEAAQAEGADMARNIEELKKIIPPDQPYYKIEAKLGTPWVSHENYARFAADLLGNASTDGIDISFRLGAWRVKFSNPSFNHKPEAQTIWGVGSYRFDKLIQAAMNNSAVTIWGRDADGNKVVDTEATSKANEKAGALREEFTSWVWKDAGRKVALEKEYNEVMNCTADTAFDGSFLTFPGMALTRGSSAFNLRKHQSDAIWRGLLNKGGLYAHEVGTGKTYTIAGLAVESRRYGIAKKPLLLAHNANSATVAREANEMYPGAKILYVDNLAPDKIDTTMRQIANDDWDLVVVPHSLISRFGLKKETLNALAADEIEAMEQEALEAAEEDGVGLTREMMDDEDQMKKVRSATAKQLVHARNRIVKKIEDMAMTASKENAIPFEELGIDMIIVDEAHEFKKPPIATKMRMKGLNTATSGQSLSLHLLSGYVKSLNAGKGVHLFTGTPVTNTLTEIYHMMRYVMDGDMERNGIKAWDSWFNTFADSVSDVELTAAGDYEAVTRLAAIVNVPELRRMAGQYTDIVFADDMPEFKPRTTASGKTLHTPGLSDAERDELINGRRENPQGRPYKKIIVDVSPMGQFQKDVLEHLVELSRTFRNATKKERREMMLSGHPASPVLVETAAANAGMDPRLYDKDAPDDPNSKVNKCVKNILDIYRGHDNAAQVVFMERGFSDKSTSTKTMRDGSKVKTTRDRFNLSRDIVDKLVAGGIPREQISVIDGSTSKEKRKQNADAMNRGDVRVTIGNTKTLGVGVNMQENLRAIHHLDAPWMPGELEQRNGRGWRQGNKWNTLQEIRYVTEKLDGRRWQVLVVKDRFIKAYLKAKDDVRVIDGDAVSSEDEGMGDLTETLSEAAGDPRILLREKYKKDIEKLQNRERTHAFGIRDAEQTADRTETEIVNISRRVGMLDSVIEHYTPRKEEFSCKIGNKVYSDRTKAQKALDKAIEEIGKPKGAKKVGELYGLDINVSWNFFSQEHVIRMTLPGVTDRAEPGLTDFQKNGDFAFIDNRLAAKPSIRSMEGVLRNLDKKRDESAAAIATKEQSVSALRDSAKEPFPRAAELAKKQQMLADLMRDMDQNPVPPPSWLRHGAPVGGEVYHQGAEYPVAGHKWDDTGYFVTIDKDGTLENIPYMETTDENGLPVYEEHEFEAPVVATAKPDGNIESDAPQSVTLDSMGLQQIYERLADTKLVKDAMADLKRLGGHVYAQGSTAWKPWFQGMKDSLGKLFRRFRPTMEKLYATTKSDARYSKGGKDADNNGFAGGKRVRDYGRQGNDSERDNSRGLSQYADSEPESHAERVRRLAETSPAGLSGKPVALPATRPGGETDDGRRVSGSKYSLRTDRTGDPRVDAVLDKIGSPDKTMADRIKDSLGNLAHKETRMREIEQGFFDRYASLRYLDKMAGITGPDDSAYISARMSTSFSDVMYAMVHHGHPVWKDGGSAVSGKGLMEIFKPVADELDVFMGWMVGARAQKLMNEGRERYFDQDEINILKGLKTPENSARWEKVRRDYMQYKKQVLDFAEQAGVINPEARKIWDHEEYVPFYRVVEDKPKGPFKVKGLASQNSGIRTLKGADERLGDIFENIIRNFSHLTDAAIKNRATELAVQKAEQIGAATPAPLEWKAVKIGNQQVVDAVHEFFGETQDDIDAFVNPEEMEAFTTFFHPAKPMGKDVIHVLRDGKPQYYQVHDDLLLRSMTSINEQIWGGPAMTFMRFVKRLLTIGVTSDPTFMLRNFIRDTLHTWTISRGDFTPVISSLTGAVKAFREDDDMVQLMAAGGAFHGGFAYGNDPAAVKLMVRKLITKKGIDRNTILDTVKKVWEAYQEIGSAMENAARVQTYANAKAKTGSHLQAAFDAKDIMDFSMRGDWAAINFLVQTVPFLGARIQGLQRLGKGAMENPVAFTLKGSAIALASTLLWLHNSMRPEYQELEEWDKDTYFHFFVGKKHFRLPKPFEVGAIFGTMPERLMELTLEKQHDGGLFFERMMAILTQTFAVGLPQILNEPMQQWANKDFFTGREIVGRDLQRLLPGEQSNPYTSATAKELGRAVHMSPRRLEHAVKGYFGALGMYCMGASDILVRKLWDYPSEPATKPEDWPVLSAFYRGEGPARNTKYTTEFYELLREADQLTDTIQRLRETGEVPRADKLIEKNLPKLAVGGILGQVQSELSRINKQMKRVHLDRSMSPDEKKAQLVELQRIKNDITRGVVGQAKVERNQ